MRRSVSRGADLLLGGQHVFCPLREEQREDLVDQGLHVVLGGQDWRHGVALADQGLGERVVQLVKVNGSAVLRRSCGIGHGLTNLWDS